MVDNKFKPYPTEKEPNSGPKGHHPPPHPELPPHILKEIFDLKEKVGRLEGQIEVLLRLNNK